MRPEVKSAGPRRRPRGAAASRAARAASWLVLAGLLAAAGPAASQDVALGRHAELACGACHVVGADGRPLAPVALAGEATALCARCHASFTDQHSGANHPSGVVPARPLPAEYPLDARGRMTCLTCHALHGGAPALLRGTGPRACLPCHPK